MSDFIEKRHVRMINAQGHVAEDFVPVEILDAYIEDARKRWQFVDVVSDEHRPGPAGDDGLTHYPHHLSHGHEHRGLTVDRNRVIQATIEED